MAFLADTANSGLFAARYPYCSHRSQTFHHGSHVYYRFAPNWQIDKFANKNNSNSLIKSEQTSIVVLVFVWQYYVQKYNLQAHLYTNITMFPGC